MSGLFPGKTWLLLGPGGGRTAAAREEEGGGGGSGGIREAVAMREGMVRASYMFIIHCIHLCCHHPQSLIQPYSHTLPPPPPSPPPPSPPPFLWPWIYLGYTLEKGNALLWSIKGGEQPSLRVWPRLLLSYCTLPANAVYQWWAWSFCPSCCL